MVSGGRKGAAFLFLKECVFSGTINAQFQSLFCQNMYVYMILGVARGQHPLPKKILYLVG